MDPWRSVHAARIRAYLSTSPQDSRNLDSAKPAPHAAIPTQSRPPAPVLRGPWGRSPPPDPRSQPGEAEDGSVQARRPTTLSCGDAQKPSQ
jgi:hypothetical protein